MAGTGRIQHAQADEAAVERFVAGATAGDQGDLALDRAAGPEDDEVGGVDADDVPAGAAEAGQAFRDEIGDVVEELLHGITISFEVGGVGVRRPRPAPAARAR